MLKRSLTLLCSLAVLSASACTPQPAGNPGGASTPDAVDAASNLVLEAELILSAENDAGIENPITPDQIEAIEIDGESYSASDLELEEGSFAVLQSKQRSFRLNYKVVQMGNKKAYAYRIMRQRGTSRPSNADAVNFLYRHPDKGRQMIQLLSGRQLLDELRRLRLLQRKDGTIIGGSPDRNGLLDRNALRFKILNNRLEVFKAGKKQLIDPQAPPENFSPEQGENASEMELQSLDLPPISPVGLFVGEWTLSLLGQELMVNIQESGVGQMRASTQFNDQSFSGTASYDPNEAQTDQLQLSARGPAGETIGFEARVQENNQLKLQLTDTASIQELAPFASAALVLKRKL
ncbi:MAG: hypothetical protein IGS03_14495 [Candidatus Sericytochromatia bacterium]|nr:hypothetical protein [Candidatus Sericytochromatia bacterium]